MSLNVKKSQLKDFETALGRLPALEVCKGVASSEKFTLEHGTPTELGDDNADLTLPFEYIRVPVTLTHEDYDCVATINEYHIQGQYDRGSTRQATIQSLFKMLISDIDYNDLQTVGNDMLDGIESATGREYVRLDGTELKKRELDHTGGVTEMPSEYTNIDERDSRDISKYADDHTFEIRIDSETATDAPDDFESYLYQLGQSHDVEYDTIAEVLGYDGDLDEKILSIECQLPDESTGWLHYNVDNDTDAVRDMLAVAATKSGDTVSLQSIEKLDGAVIPVTKHHGNWVVDLEATTTTQDETPDSTILSLAVFLLICGCIPLGLLFLLGVISLEFVAVYGVLLALGVVSIAV